ncbi:MAG: hypothetical protein AVDCRST_MAG10-1484, partial [uncultured Acidimicrobiales bacterium]
EVPGHLEHRDRQAVRRDDEGGPAHARPCPAAGGAGQGDRPLPHRRQPWRGMDLQRVEQRRARDAAGPVARLQLLPLQGVPAGRHDVPARHARGI